jgi:cytochrome c peroxidase
MFLFTALFIAAFTPFYADHAAQTRSGRRERKIQEKVFSQIVSFRDYIKDTLFFAVIK